MSKKTFHGWSLDPQEWKNLRSALGENDAWAVVPFKDSYWASVAEKPGVYLVCGAPPVIDGKPHTTFCKPLYIGRAESSIRNRFIAHVGESCQSSIRELRTAYIGSQIQLTFYYRVLPRKDVPIVESLLIDCYGPPANKIRGARLLAGQPAG